MPGTPVIYYGDEIGMGDNIYLGDRDGVRTPMQWSLDRNGGFSRADPAKLFLPAIQDPVYGFSAVNVEAQLASPSSLLTWMRRMVAVRRSHLSFGRGTLRFLYPSNRKVLAYLREFEGERILCVANVSRAAQAVELDLAEFKDTVPIELTAGSVFPAINSRSYLLTLPAYGFFWFRLEATEASKAHHDQQPAPGLLTLVATGKLETILAGRERIAFERTVAPRFLASRHWFGDARTPIGSVSVKDFAVLRNGGQSRFVLPVLDRELPGGQVETYFTPLAAEPEREDGPPLVHAAARLRRGGSTGLLYEAEACEGFAPAILAALRRGERLDTDQGGTISFLPSPHLATEPMIETVRYPSYWLGTAQLLTRPCQPDDAENPSPAANRRRSRGRGPAAFDRSGAFLQFPSLARRCRTRRSRGKPHCARDPANFYSQSGRRLDLDARRIEAQPRDGRPNAGARRPRRA